MRDRSAGSPRQSEGEDATSTSDSPTTPWDVVRPPGNQGADARATGSRLRKDVGGFRVSLNAARESLEPRGRHFRRGSSKEWRPTGRGCHGDEFYPSRNLSVDAFIRDF